MLLIKRVASSISISIILVSIIMSSSLIFVMFTSGKTLGRHLGLFGSIFFESKETSKGSILITFGLNNYIPVLLLFASMAIICFIFQIIYSRLKIYKANLILKDPNHTRHD